MNELKTVETVMFFLAYISGVGVDYFIGYNKGRRKL